MTHRLNAFLLALAVLIGLPCYWLFLSNPPRAVAPHPVTIAQLRDLADALPGPRPTDIAVIHVGSKWIPGNFYAAGSGMRRRQLGILAWRLTVPGKGPVMIDSGSTAPLMKAMAADTFRPRAQAMLDRAFQQASLILATSERPQHLGGLAAYARQVDSAVALAHARLQTAQVPGAPSAAAAGWSPSLALHPAIRGTAPFPVAPGIVVIPTNAPTPGSQMIFVRLASGREYVLAGDVAPFHVNFAELRVRSHLLDLHVSPARRSEQMRWLITLRALARSAPGLLVLPGHDIEWVLNRENRTNVIDLAGPSPS